jgi:hypothetical protein
MRTVEKEGIEAEPRMMRVRDPLTGKNVVVNEMSYEDWQKWVQSRQYGDIIGIRTASGDIIKNVTAHAVDWSGERSISSDDVVNALKKRLPAIKVDFFDERFTSVLAHRAMLDGGLKKKDRQNKALVDEISATIILQDYLESKRYL